MVTDFVVPQRETMSMRYQLETEKVDKGDGHWSYQHSKIWLTRIDDTRLEVVGEFTYHYSMRPPFHAFRQLRDGVWRDYALLAEDYTQLSVMDLSSGEIVAVEQPTAEAVARAAEVIEKYHQDDPRYTPDGLARGWGFCPVDFYVPDWWENQDGSIMPGDQYWDEEDERRIGDFGVYSGCVWGDDSGWKLQYVDLSRISEGEVTTDNRFGYVELPSQVKLNQAVQYWDEADAFRIAVDVPFLRDTGKASWYSQAGINWGEEPPK